MTPRPLPCEEARGLLDERLDRRLGPEEEAALRGHLGLCASCREEEAALERVHGALLAMEPADPGPGFADRVVAALDRAPDGVPGHGHGPPAAAPGRRLGARLLGGLVAAAGTVAVAALAVAVFPVDAAASTVGDLLPGMAPPALPGIPPAAAELLAGLPALLPPWAAALGALAALAAAALPVAALRRGARRP